jgi:hypothetical protein
MGVGERCTYRILRCLNIENIKIFTLINVNMGQQLSINGKKVKTSTIKGLKPGMVFSKSIYTRESIFTKINTLSLNYTPLHKTDNSLNYILVYTQIAKLYTPQNKYMNGTKFLDLNILDQVFVKNAIINDVGVDITSDHKYQLYMLLTNEEILYLETKNKCDQCLTLQHLIFEDYMDEMLKLVTRLKNSYARVLLEMFTKFDRTHSITIEFN